MFDTPHAETHAIMLPYAVSYLQPAVPAAARRLAQAMDADEHALAREHLVAGPVGRNPGRAAVHRHP